MVLVKIAPEYLSLKNQVLKDSNYMEVNIGTEIEIYPQKEKSIIFGREKK